jgi:hypothetical protein
VHQGFAHALTFSRPPASRLRYVRDRTRKPASCVTRRKASTRGVRCVRISAQHQGASPVRLKVSKSSTWPRSIWRSIGSKVMADKMKEIFEADRKKVEQ